MKKIVIIVLVISCIIGCTTTPKNPYDEYENSISTGNKVIQINKEFQYIGNIRTSKKLDSINFEAKQKNLEKKEHFFIHLNNQNKIDKCVIVYSFTLTNPQQYWRKEADFSKDKNYKANMYMGHLEINNTKCPCVVKKWPRIGKRYTEYAKEQGYEFDMSKGCLVEAKIGKTIGRYTMIAVSYIEGFDNCTELRNIDGENTKIIENMLSKLQTNVNMK